jgi:hypothetical protein
MINMAYWVIPQKGHPFNVEMASLAGKCSLIPDLRGKSGGRLDRADQEGATRA